MAKYVKTYNEDLQLVGMQETNGNGSQKQLLATISQPITTNMSVTAGANGETKSDVISNIIMRGQKYVLRITFQGKVSYISDVFIGLDNTGAWQLYSLVVNHTANVASQTVCVVNITIL